MTQATTLFHIHARDESAIERALHALFTHEGRAEALRVEGMYRSVLARLERSEAAYRYLLLRPRAPAGWAALAELGNRTVGLDVELSRALGGAAVVALVLYGDAVSGYRVTRDGIEVDRYLSDPDYLAAAAAEGDSAGATAASPLDAEAMDAARGHPERFAELLPPGTAPERFRAVVLRPGWWEAHETLPDAAAAAPIAADDDADEAGDVDETDRRRCLGLAFELWAPDAYPLSGELEDVPDAEAGPAVGLAFA